jgi:phosphoribosylglycinamide formyltransferase-1
MRNVVCLISGRGSNLESLLRAERAERWDQRFGARIAAVISNRPRVRGLEIAGAAGVDTATVDERSFEERGRFEVDLAAAIEAHEPALVVLAGFMRVLGAGFVARFGGRLINIHPSLLPAFPGLHTHRRALEQGTRVHGATVHFVSPDVDAGPIIAQAVVRVLPGDTETALAARVLAAEHRLLPRCAGWILDGRVALRDGRAVVDGIEPDQLLAIDSLAPEAR